MTSDDEGAKKFIAEKKITFRSLRSDWEWALKHYGVDATPANFIIDRQGKILFTHHGFHGPEGAEMMGYQIEEILGRSQSDE